MDDRIRQFHLVSQGEELHRPTNSSDAVSFELFGHRGVYCPSKSVHALLHLCYAHPFHRFCADGHVHFAYFELFICGPMGEDIDNLCSNNGTLWWSWLYFQTGFRNVSRCPCFICISWSTPPWIYGWNAWVSLSIWTWSLYLDLRHDLCTSLR